MPSEAEVGATLQFLKRNKARGHSHLRDKYLQGWLREAFPVKDSTLPQPGTMGKTGEAGSTHVEVQHTPNRADLNHLSPAPQRKRGHLGVGLLEVLFKLVLAITDTWIKTLVTLHDVLHGFRAIRGMGTAIMELNIAQDISSIDQHPLLLVFQDLWGV